MLQHHAWPDVGDVLPVVIPHTRRPLFKPCPSSSVARTHTRTHTHTYARTLTHADTREHASILCSHQSFDFPIHCFVSSSLFLASDVATRYYRAPEVIMTWEHYKLPLDMWSFGCIMGEMLMKGKSRVLFRYCEPTTPTPTPLPRQRRAV